MFSGLYFVIIIIDGNFYIEKYKYDYYFSEDDNFEFIKHIIDKKILDIFRR